MEESYNKRIKKGHEGFLQVPYKETKHKDLRMNT